MIENEQKDHNARMTDKATTERIKASATATRASRAGAPKPVDRGKAMADLDAQIRTKLSGTYGQGKVVVPGAYGTQTETPVPAEQTKKILESSPYTPESEYAKFAWTMNPDQARKAGIPKPASVQTDSSMTPVSTGTPHLDDIIVDVEKRAAAGDTAAVKGLPVLKALKQGAMAGDTASINQLQSRGIAWQ
jgi:peptidoglycan hydrolase-like protein with peptidoglycan-binding domain